MGWRTTEALVLLKPSLPPDIRRSNASRPYFTGSIKCAYGVPGNMTYGTFVLSAVVGYPSNFVPMLRIITCGPVSTHLPPGEGFVAKGSALLASEPPTSMYPKPILSAGGFLCAPYQALRKMLGGPRAD